MVIATLECPNCGSNLHFDIKTQAFPCNSCRSTFSFKQLEELIPEQNRGKIWDTVEAGTADVEIGALYERDSGTYDSTMERRSCPRCGAEIVTEPGTSASFCMFCGNHAVLQGSITVDDKAPSRIIPFQVTREAAEAAYLGMCKGKPFLPKAFKAKEHLEDFRSMYVPFRLYSSVVSGSLSAIGENITTWSDSEYDYMRTDTYQVRRVGSLEFKDMPFDASEIMDDELMRSIEPFDAQKLTEFSTRYLSGHSVANPDTPAEKLMTGFRERTASETEQALRNTVNYSRVSVQSSRTSLGDVDSEYVVFPVWALTTQYKKKTYFFAMNGLTGKKTGSLPISGGQILKVIGSIFGITTAAGFLFMEVMTWLGMR